MPHKAREITNTDAKGALRLLGIYIEKTLDPHWSAKIKALPESSKYNRTAGHYQNRINRARFGLTDLHREVERMADE